MSWRPKQACCEHYKKVFADTGEEQATSKRCKNLLIKQLKLNEQIWTILQNGGITDDDEFCFNFKFIAQDRSAGESLKHFICGKTNYDADVTLEGFLKKTWIVQGATKPLKASKQVIDEWVAWMVMAGFKHRCDFCGWWIWKYNLVRLRTPYSSQSPCGIIESRRGLVKSSRFMHSVENPTQEPFKNISQE